MSILARVITIARCLFSRVSTATTRDLSEALDARAKGREPLDWRHSIVDLLKLLDRDSSRDARELLAQEFGYKGNYTGTAEQNIWLHKQVLDKLKIGGVP